MKLRDAMWGGRLGPMVVCALMPGLISCGEASQNSEPDADAASTVAGTPASLPLLEIVASDSGFSVPEQITGGWTRISTLGADPQTNGHQMILVRLDDIADAGAFVQQARAGGRAVDAPLDGAVYVGGGKAVVHLSPGRYAVVCGGLSPDGTAHFGNGEERTFDVVGDAGAAEPVSDVTIVLSDYSVEIEGRLRQGAQLVRVENRGSLIHEVTALVMSEGSSSSDIVAWLATREGPPPMAGIAGELPAMSPNRKGYLTLDLSGEPLALVCFLGSGPEDNHLMRGMAVDVTVEEAM